MNKRFLALLAFSALTLCSCAETIYDLLPTGGSHVTPPQSFTPISVVPHDVKEGQTAMKFQYSTFTENGVGTISYSPSLGESKLLLIPVWFNDSKTFIQPTRRDQIREDIRKTYLGSTAETGWHSVKSYYETESMGRLKLSGTVSDWYETTSSYMNFAAAEEGGENTLKLLESATNWYFSKNPSEKRTDYDKDGDGYLDGVMLIYAAPDYVSLGKDRQSDSYGNLWAYCFWLQDHEKQSKANPGVNVFFWASYDFMYDGSHASSRTGLSRCGKGNNTVCFPDAHTYIHEMGHVFGLEDYYDYGPSQYNHAGGFSMQDYNVGGHDPFSAIALGWTDPYIPTESTEITLSIYEKEHDCILLTPSWNSVDSPFDEYLLLELYSPYGLNELDANYKYENILGPRSIGIRLWHVDARLVACNEVESDSYYNYPVYSISDLTVDPRDGVYGTRTAFTNTVDDEDYGTPLGSTYDKYSILKLIRNSAVAPLHNKATIDSSDLFGNGAEFSMSRFKSQFANQTKLNSGEELGWSFKVTLTGSGSDTQAKVTLTKA